MLQDDASFATKVDACCDTVVRQEGAHIGSGATYYAPKLTPMMAVAGPHEPPSTAMILDKREYQETLMQ